jgi:hypothetical protein
MLKKGAKTNITGNQLEITVKTVLLAKGFELVNFSEWIKNPDAYSHELLLSNAPFTTIYGHKGKTEFLLKSEKYGFDIRIECKWQQVAGSVDEKLPYLYLNAIEAMPEKDIIILIDGEGWKAGAIQWLKMAIEDNMYTNVFNHGKNIRVLSITEFFTWVNNTFQ